MYSLIVLGIIPGTDIQISFELWLKSAGVLIILLSMMLYVRTHRTAISKMLTTRGTLHASQLHSRLSY